MAKDSGNDKGKKQELEKARPARALSPFTEMERMFENMFAPSWVRPMRWEWPSWSEMAAPFEGRMPKVDVIDRDGEVVVRAELPGVDKKDLDVSVSNNAVSIKAKTREEHKEEKGDYYRCEISQGSYARTVALPSDVDGDKAKAVFKDGVLELTLPKVAGSRKQSIKVE